MDAVVAEAAKLGYPVNEMAIGGGSAGGCLALLYAYRDTAESPVPVRFVFEAVGPSSFYPEDWDNYGLDKPEAQAEAAGLFGVMTGAKLTPDMFGTPAYDAAVKDASALLWVTKDAVPTVMAYCTHDTMQPFKASVRLDRALTENGVPHDCFVAEHSGHGLQNDSAVYRQYLETVIADRVENVGVRVTPQRPFNEERPSS